RLFFLLAILGPLGATVTTRAGVPEEPREAKEAEGAEGGGGDESTNIPSNLPIAEGEPYGQGSVGGGTIATPSSGAMGMATGTGSTSGTEATGVAPTVAGGLSPTGTAAC